jgi:hypothetical protein
MEETNQESSLFDFSIDETAKDHLRRISNWAMVTVVCAVIGYVVEIIKALQPASRIVQREGFGMDIVGGSNLLGTILEIIIGLVVNYFLFQFANLTRKGVNGLSQGELNAGFYNLKIYFIIIGVFVIIVLMIVLLLVILGVSVGSVK